MSAGACRTSGISLRMLILRKSVAMPLMLRLTVAISLMLRLPVAILPLFSNGLRT